jgi:predicted nucleotidyltransferase
VSTPGVGLESAVARCIEEEDGGVVSAYLYGSVAEGRDHRESDVDVGVLLSRQIYPRAADRFDVRLRLSTRLGAALGRDADLVVLNDAPPQLARRIMTGGRRVVSHDPEADHAFLRTTLSRAADLQPFLDRTRRTKLAAVAR